MKKTILAVLTLSLVSMNAFADQAATLTCTGKNIILQEKSPYLGENSKFSQSLFILKNKSADESSDTAYFLEISYDVGKFGVTYISGKNEVGGTFELVTNFPQDTGDGTVIHEVSTGTLKFNHGPLKGKEVVNCVRE